MHTMIKHTVVKLFLAAVTTVFVAVGAAHASADPGDDWIPWDRVIRVFNSQQECLNYGQALADRIHVSLNCQRTKAGAWVLFTQ